MSIRVCVCVFRCVPEWLSDTLGRCFTHLTHSGTKIELIISISGRLWIVPLRQNSMHPSTWLSLFAPASCQPGCKIWQKHKQRATDQTKFISDCEGMVLTQACPVIGAWAVQAKVEIKSVWRWLHRQAERSPQRESRFSQAPLRFYL